jgi:hypothetical protein
MPFLPIADVNHIRDKPLTLRRLADEDYQVMAGEMPTGRIFKTVRSERTVWFWTITGPYLNAPELKVAGSGEVATLDEARKAFRASFDAWLAWVQAGGKPAVWNA